MPKILIDGFKKEIKIWEELKSYVKKNMKGKTLTKPLEKEISFMIKERKAYRSAFLKN